MRGLCCTHLCLGTWRSPTINETAGPRFLLIAGRRIAIRQLRRKRRFPVKESKGWNITYFQDIVIDRKRAWEWHSFLITHTITPAASCPFYNHFFFLKNNSIKMAIIIMTPHRMK